MAEEEAWLELLGGEQVDAFNARRTERTRLELFAADLAERKLCGVDLSGANLEKSDLSGTDLTDANLTRANLAGIDASGAILVSATALRARFKEAWLDGADLSGGDFTEADLADAHLEGSTARGASFPKARLRGVDLTGACWAEADLGGAKLPEAILVDADLSGADLTEAVLGEADLTRCRLDGARATGCRLTQARLPGARLRGAILQNASLVGADLTGADLSAADLSRANLSGANLSGAVLRGALLADANLDGATLTGADLTEADLSGLDPVALGLAGEVVARLSGFGVQVDADAPLRFSEVSCARVGAACAVVWANPEGEPPPAEETPAEGEEEAEPVEPQVWRYLVMHPGGRACGPIPVPGHTVLDAQVVPFGDGFRVVVTRSRPEGAVLMVLPLSATGALGQAKAVPLGYEPAVSPVLRVEAGRLRMYGLARTGPTLVVHDLTDQPKPVRSDRSPTARGFIQGHPVLSVKGGVVIPVGPQGPAAPRRIPETFPGVAASALPFGEDLLAVWAVERAGRAPGGVRWAVIGRHGAPREEVLDQRAGVSSVVALPAVARPPARPDDDPTFQVRVFWLQLDEKARRTRVWTALLPDGEPAEVEAPEDVTELGVAPGVLSLVLSDGEVNLRDPETLQDLGSAP